ARCDADHARLRRPEKPRFSGNSARHRLFDLFSGCGGLTAGLLLAAEELGLELGIALAVEHDDAPAAVYEANFGVKVDRIDADVLLDGSLGDALTTNERRLKKRVGAI